MANSTLSLVVLTMSACVAQGTTPDSTTTIPPTGTETTPPPKETALTLASEYQLESKLSLTVGSTLPPPAYELLRDLNEDPGAALVTIAETAGLPAAGLLFDALPNSLSGKVTGWMSTAIGASEEFQVLMAWSNVVLAEVELASTLSIETLDADNHAGATHVLDALRFDLDGRTIEQEIPSIDDLPGAGHADLELWLESDEEGEHLVLGQERFGLLFGEAAYRAFENAVTNRYGSDLRGLLASSIDCAAMAVEVSERCVLGVCVGHASELEALCDAGIDEAVSMIHEQFTAYDTEILRLQSGSSLLVAGESEGSTLLQTGEWAAEADFGLGLRSVDASYEGASAP